MPMISHSSIRYWAKAKSQYAFSIRTGVKARSVETIFCGLWRVRHLHNRRLLTDRLEAGSAPLTLWQAATADTLPDDSLLPPPVAGLMNGLPLAHELLAHVRDPALQPHSINLTQLPLSEADRLFSGTFMRTREHPDSHLRVWRKPNQRHSIAPSLACALSGRP